MLGQAVVLEFEVEIPRREKRGILEGRLAGCVLHVAPEHDTHLALQTARQADQALAVLGEEILVDPRLIVEALEISRGDKAAEVPVSGLVLDEQDQVEMVVVAVAGLFLEAGAGGDIDLAAQDGLDALGLGLLEELDRAENVAVVGQGHGRHVELDRGRDEVADLERAVQDTVFRMVMKMYKRVFHILS